MAGDHARGDIGFYVAGAPMTASSLAADNGRLLRYVLDDLRYPARWWEIMAMADMYGVAAVHHAELARLPRMSYADLEAILHALIPAGGAVDHPTPRWESRLVRPTPVRRPPSPGGGSFHPG